MLDAVCPLRLRDFPRFALLASSLTKYSTDLNICWVVVPDGEMDAVREQLKDKKFRVIPESDVVPELKYYKALASLARRSLPGWYIQQIIKLAIVPYITTPFYLTLDADVICVRPFKYVDMVSDGRAISFINRDSKVYSNWSESSERVLGMKGSGVAHGVTPSLLNCEAITLLRQHLEQRVAWPLCFLGSILPKQYASCFSGYRAYLIRNLPWTEYTLYHTFLAATGLGDKYHLYTTEPAVYDEGASLWLEENIQDWQPTADLPAKVWFLVVQSTANLPISAVKEKLAGLI